MAFNFTLPVIGVTTDSTWSQDFLDAFNKIEAHTHTGLTNDAAQINAASLLITQDFSVNGFNIINPRSVILQNLTSDPSGTGDVCSLYFKNGNFYISNQIGTHVQITNGGSLNISSTVASVFSYVASSTSFNLLNTDTYTYLAINSTGGARSLFLPSASTVPTGRFITVKDSAGTSETNAISFVPAGSDTIDTVAANYIVRKTFGSWMLVSNGVNGWYVSSYSNSQLNNGLIISTGSGIHIAGASTAVLIDSGVSVELAVGTNTVTVGTANIGISTTDLVIVVDTTEINAATSIELGTNSCILSTTTGTVFNFNASPSSNTTNFDHALTASSISLGNLAHQYDGQINGQLMLSGTLVNDADILIGSTSTKIIYYTAATTGRTVTLDTVPLHTQFRIVNPTGQTIRVTNLGSFDKNLITNKWLHIWYDGPAWVVIGYGDLL